MGDKIFLDCGAWKGNSISYFLETFENAKDYQIYAFECNTDIVSKLRNNIRKNNIDNVNIIEKALWDSDGVRTFKVGVNKYSESSSLLQSKRIIRHNKSNDMRVECINFSNWIKTNLKKDDYIICKLNIEGAEYRVLNKLIGDKTIDYINELHVAWHWKKVRYSEEQHNILVSQLERRRLKYQIWSLEHGI